MLKKISMDNFRSFKNATVNLRQINVVVGPNSSGKTTLLHAIRAAVAAFKIAIEDEYEKPQLFGNNTIRVAKDMVVREHVRLVPVSDWRLIFTDTTVGSDITANISLEFDDGDPLQSINVKLGYGRNNLLKADVEIQSTQIAKATASLKAKAKGRPQRIRSLIADVLPKAVFVPAFFGVTLDEEYRNDAVMDRLIERGRQGQVVRNLLSRLDDTSGAMNRLNKFLSESVGATITHRTAKAVSDSVEHLIVRFRDSNGDLDLSAAGAGLINLISLFAAMERSRPADREKDPPTIFLLDEPEAHLHPKLQGDLGEAIARLVREFGTQSLIATHSVEMINRLGLQEDVELLHAERSTGRIAELTTHNAIIECLTDWCDLTPFTALNFLARRKLLFHEGPSDKMILDACARLYFRNDPSRLHRYNDWTTVELGGVSNAGTPKVLANLVSPKLFSGLSAGPRMRMICLLDRDVSREQRYEETEKKTGPKLLDVVWSRYSIESLFLDEPILTGWLAPTVEEFGLDSSRLGSVVRDAIAVADSNQNLLDNAADMLMRQLLRGETKPTEATKQARERVRAEPAVYQHGRERAKCILSEIRAKLDAKNQNKIRSSITDMLQSAPTDKLGNPLTLIPSEIVKVLDTMVKPDS